MSAPAVSRPSTERGWYSGDTCYAKPPLFFPLTRKVGTMFERMKSHDPSRCPLMKQIVIGTYHSHTEFSNVVINISKPFHCVLLVNCLYSVSGQCDRRQLAYMPLRVSCLYLRSYPSHNGSSLLGTRLCPLCDGGEVVGGAGLIK